MHHFKTRQIRIECRWFLCYTRCSQNRRPPPKMQKHHVCHIHSFIPSALCTLKACLMDKSNMISSEPPGMAYARTSLAQPLSAKITQYSQRGQYVSLTYTTAQPSRPVHPSNSSNPRRSGSPPLHRIQTSSSPAPSVRQSPLPASASPRSHSSPDTGRSDSPSNYERPRSGEPCWRVSCG